MIASAPANPRHALAEYQIVGLNEQALAMADQAFGSRGRTRNSSLLSRASTKRRIRSSMRKWREWIQLKECESRLVSRDSSGTGVAAHSPWIRRGNGTGPGIRPFTTWKNRLPHLLADRQVIAHGETTSPLEETLSASDLQWAHREVGFNQPALSWRVR